MLACLTTMDVEQSEALLAPSVEYLASVKVFPLIPNLRRDITVSNTRATNSDFPKLFCAIYSLSPAFQKIIGVCIPPMSGRRLTILVQTAH